MELSSLEKQHNQSLQKRETLNGSHPSKLLKATQHLSIDQEEAQHIINQQQQQQPQQQQLTNLISSNGTHDLIQQQQNHILTQEIQRTAFARAHFRHVAVRGLIGKFFSKLFCTSTAAINQSINQSSFRA